MVKRAATKDPRAALLEKAATAASESRQLDFKGEHHDTKEGWCGIIKDIVAMANSGGGLLIFGCNSDGTKSDYDCSSVLEIDVADLTNRIFSYTGFHLGEIEILEVSRGETVCPALMIGETDVPIPFTKPGEYEVTDKNGKAIKKTAFATGTVYFRHGGKSEPATRSDLETWIKRHASRDRKSMMENVKKVVTAPPGHVVSVVPSGARPQWGENGVKVRLSNDADAIKVSTVPLDKSHPHKRNELIRQVKKKSGKLLGLHDVTSLNHHFKVFSQRPDLAIKPHKDTSPQYSDTYAEFLSQEIARDPALISKARDGYKNRSI